MEDWNASPYDISENFKDCIQFRTDNLASYVKSFPRAPKDYVLEVQYTFGTVNYTILYRESFYFPPYETEVSIMQRKSFSQFAASQDQTFREGFRRCGDF